MVAAIWVDLAWVMKCIDSSAIQDAMTRQIRPHFTKTLAFKNLLMVDVIRWGQFWRAAKL